MSRPGRAISGEVRLELASTLGRSSESLEALKMFHVKGKGDHCFTCWCVCVVDCCSML